MIKLDITNKVKYEECKDTDGRFVLISYKDIPIAEIRIRPGWINGKKVQACFKVFYCEDHPIDYCWINLKTKKKL